MPSIVLIETDGQSAKLLTICSMFLDMTVTSCIKSFLLFPVSEPSFS